MSWSQPPAGRFSFLRGLLVRGWHCCPVGWPNHQKKQTKQHPLKFCVTWWSQLSEECSTFNYHLRTVESWPAEKHEPEIGTFLGNHLIQQLKQRAGVNYDVSEHFHALAAEFVWCEFFLFFHILSHVLKQSKTVDIIMLADFDFRFEERMI